MLKNTEYGAILLLGASDYGKQGSSIEARRMDRGATSGTSTQASTTGNKYGVYEMGYENMSTTSAQFEWTAAGVSTFLSGVDDRYRNIYTSSTDSALAGDATYETAWWHGSGYANWVTNGLKGMFRGNTGSFAYSANNEYWQFGARAAVVCESRNLMWF